MRVRLAFAAAVATLAAVPSLAFAAEPVKDNNPGNAASVVVDPSTVVAGGIVTFRATGFATGGRGEVVNVRLDDKAILPADISKSDVWATYTAAADGSFTGSIDLSQANASTPVLPGRHWIRLLTGSGNPGDTPRSLHADFTVIADPDADPGTTPVIPTTPGTASPAPNTPTVTKPLEITPNGVVWLTDPVIKRTKTKKKIAVKVRGGASGSAGRVTVTTKEKFKIGKGAAKKRTVSRSTSYFVDRVGSSTVNLTLTSDATTLLKRKKELKVLLVFKDANGEDTIKQDATVSR